MFSSSGCCGSDLSYSDRQGELPYRIKVATDNDVPVITKIPDGEHFIHGWPDDNLIDPVTPDSLYLTIGKDDELVVPVSIDLMPGEAAVDMVFVVDESTSMGDVQGWLPDLIEEIDNELQTTYGIGTIEPNQYGLISFGGDRMPTAFEFASGNLLGSVTELSAAVSNNVHFVLNGSTEDGFRALQEAIRDDGNPATINYRDEMRSAASKNFVVITDEGRDFGFDDDGWVDNPYVYIPPTAPEFVGLSDLDSILLELQLLDPTIQVDLIAPLYFGGNDNSGNLAGLAFHGSQSWEVDEVSGKLVSAIPLDSEPVLAISKIDANQSINSPGINTGTLFVSAELSVSGAIATANVDPEPPVWPPGNVRYRTTSGDESFFQTFDNEAPQTFVAFDHTEAGGVTSHYWLGFSVGSRWLRMGYFEDDGSGGIWTTHAASDASAFLGVPSFRFAAGETYELATAMRNLSSGIANQSIRSYFRVGAGNPYSAPGNSSEGWKFLGGIGFPGGNLSSELSADHAYRSFNSEGRLGLGTTLPGGMEGKLEVSRLSAWGGVQNPSGHLGFSEYAAPLVHHVFGQDDYRTAIGLDASKDGALRQNVYLSNVVEVGSAITTSWTFADSGQFLPEIMLAHGMVRDDTLQGPSNLPSQFTTLIDEYAELAWLTGGSVWDLSVPRAGSLAGADPGYLNMFVSAFAHAKAQNVIEQLMEVVIDPEDTIFVDAEAVGNVDTTGTKYSLGFDATLQGDGAGRAQRNLDFVDPFQRGTIPVTINTPYTFDLEAADPDRDEELIFSLTTDSIALGVELIDGTHLRWDAPAWYRQQIESILDAGGYWQDDYPLFDSDGDNDPANDQDTFIDGWEDNDLAVDGPDGDSDPTNDQNSYMPLTATLSVEVTDSRGGSSTYEWDVTVNDFWSGATNDNPEIQPEVLVFDQATPSTATTVPDAREFRSYRIGIIAQDDDLNVVDSTERLAYYLIDTDDGNTSVPVPEGMSIDRNTGVISWTPEHDQLGSHEFTVQVVDRFGASDQRTFEVSVNERIHLNHAPSILGTLDDEVQVGQELSANLDYYDLESNSAEFYVAGGTVSRVAIHETTGELRWTPTIDDLGVQTIVIGIREVGGEEATSTRTFFIEVTPPPIPPITTTKPRLTAQLGVQYVYTPGGIDPDSVIAGIIDINDPRTTLPVGATDGNPGPGFSLHWTPSPTQINPITGVGYKIGDFVDVTLVVADETLATFTLTGEVGAIADDDTLKTIQTFTIEIVDSVNTPPQLLTKPRTVVGVGQPYVYHIEASDVDGDPLVLGFNNIPTWLNQYVDDGVPTSWYSGIAPVEALGQTYTVQVTVDDGKTGGFVPKDFDIHIVGQHINHAPEITDIEVPTAVVGRVYRLDFQATDLDDDTLIWTFDHDINASAGSLLFREDGDFAWIPSPNHVGPHDLTATVQDPSGETASVTVTIHVRATNTPPQFVNFNPPREVLAESSNYEYQVEAIDIDRGPYRLGYAFVPQQAPDWLTIDPRTGLIKVKENDEAPNTIGLQIPVGVLVSDGAIGEEPVKREFIIEVVDQISNHQQPEVRNEPPEFKKTPSKFALELTPYSFTPEVVDPEGAGTPILTLMPESQQSGMVWDLIGGVVTWTPDGSQVGEIHYLTLKATDPVDSSLFTIQRTPIFVDVVLQGDPPNLAPTFEEIDDLILSPKQEITIPLNIMDEEGHGPFGIDLVGAPAGMYVDNFNRLRYTAPDAITPQFNVSLTVTDRYGAPSAPDEFTVVVQGDTKTPYVSLLISTDNAMVLSPVNFYVQAYDDTELASVILQAKPAGSDPSQYFTIPLGQDLTAEYAFLAADQYDVIATAEDVAGNTNSTHIRTIEIFDPAGLQVPAVDIDDNLEETYLREKTTIPFSVQTPGGTPPLEWKLELIASGSDQVIVLTEGSSAVDYLTNPVSSPVEIDPLTLPDGSYQLRLTAQNLNLTNFPNATAVDTARIQIDTGEFKLGDFRVSFTDLETDFLGVSIPVTRTYSSYHIDQYEDFGPGWKVDVVEGSFTIDTPPPAFGTNDEFLSGVLPWGSPMHRGDRITLQLPGGEQQVFEVVPKPVEFNGRGVNVFSLYLDLFSLGFTRVDSDAPYDATGVVSQLQLETPRNVQFTASGELRYADDAPYNFDTDPQNNLILTETDGTVYNFNVRTKQLTSIVDPTGREIRLNGNTITATDINGLPIRAVDVERDGLNEGRVTKITARDLLDPTAPEESVVYRYDGLGRLDEVEQLPIGATSGGPITEFVYDTDANGDSIDRPYFLTRIIDNNGLTVLQTEFDADGRLDKLTDGSGNDAEFEYDTSVEGPGNVKWISERITDAKGIPTELVRDTQGRLVRQIETLAPNDLRVTDYAYDGLSNQIAVGKPRSATDATRYTLAVLALPGFSGSNFLEDQDPEDWTTADFDNMRQNWQSVSRYSTPSSLDEIKARADSRLLWEVDSAGGVTRYLAYDKFGNPTQISSPDGNTTVTQPDSATGQINFIEVTGPDGVVSKSSFGYDDQGNLKEIFQVEEFLPNNSSDDIRFINNAYDLGGRVTFTQDASGEFTYFAYDTRGNQTHTYRYWTDPNDGANKKTLVTRTRYDNRNRAEGVDQFVLDGHFVNQLTGGSDIDSTHLNGVTPLWSTSTTYDAVDRVLSQTDRYGNVTENRYDTRGNVVETRSTVSADYGSGETSYWLVTRTAFDDNGRAIVTTDPFLLTKDTNEHYVDPDDGSTSATPPIFLRATHSLYDNLGRVYESRRLQGSLAVVTISEDVDEANGNVSYEDPLYHTDFNDGYAPSGTSNPNILYITTTGYDLQGRVEYTIDAKGARTDYYYDAAGRQTLVLGPKFTDATGRVLRSLTETVYDVAGRATHTITGVAVVDQTLDRPDLSVAADLPYTSDNSKYDNAATFDKSLLAVIGQRYDGAGRVKETVLDDFTSISTEYDLLGRREAETDQLSLRKEFDYDDLGRLTKVTLPEVTDPEDGGMLKQPQYTYEYDDYGNQDAIIDPKGRRTEFTFDEQNRQISRTLPSGVESTGIDTDFVERMFYDDTPINPAAVGTESSVGNGQLAYSVDFEGNVTEYRYDNTSNGRGRLVEKVYYKEVGLAVTASTSLAQFLTLLGTASPDIASTVSYQFDALDRTTEVNDSANGITTHKYDDEGRLAQIDSPQGIINYEYDVFSRMIRTYTGPAVSGGISGNVGYVPTASQDAITDTSYTYDELGRLKTVTVIERNDDGPTGESPTEYFYDTNGNLDQTNLPNGVVSDYIYDNLNRLDDLIHYVEDGTNTGYQAAEDTLVSKFDYTVRDDGKRTQEIESDASGVVRQVDWVYDGLGRLTEERHGTGTIGSADAEDFIARYTYDLASNRFRSEKDQGNANPAAFAAGETTIYTHDANDRLLSENTTGTTTTTITYEYGGPGDPGTKQTLKTVISDTNETHIFTYGERGRLLQTSVTKGSDTTVSTYKYDDQGVRVEQSVTINGGTAEVTEYHIDPQNHTGYAKPIEEIVDGDIARSYAIGHMIISQANAIGVAQFLLHDGHGSTRVLLSAMAAVLERYAYDAFGKTLSNPGLTDAGNASTTWLFANDGQYDPTNGLTNHIARWRQGHRFLGLDPFAGNVNDPLSLHKYLYAQGNPISNIDPSGEVSLADVSSALGSGLRIASIGFRVAGAALRSAQALETTISLYQFFLGGGIHQVRQAAEQVFKSWGQLPPVAGNTRQLLQQSFWNDAVSVLSRNSAKIVARTTAQHGKSIISSFAKLGQKKGFVWLFYLPTPDPADRLIVPNPRFRIPFPGLKIAGRPVALQFGGGGGDNLGRVFGMGIAGISKEVFPKQFFRMDYHLPHGKGKKDAYYWESQGSNHRFHFHVSR